MADSLVLAAFTLFISGLLLSILITFRDFWAVKRIGHGFWWQISLVAFDIALIAFILAGIGKMITLKDAEHQIQWAELSISWVLQFMFCTNILRLIQPFSQINPVPIWLKLSIYFTLVISALLNGLIYFFLNGIARATYELLSFILILFGSIYSVWRLIQEFLSHRGSGGSNRRFATVLMVFGIMNGVAILSSGAGVAAIGFFLAQTEDNSRHRTEILLACASTQALYTYTFALSASQRLLSRLATRETSIELEG